MGTAPDGVRQDAARGRHNKDVPILHELVIPESFLQPEDQTRP